MIVHYITRENEMLDYICFKHYGYSSGAVEIVLEENYGLAEHGSFLPAGLKIRLPTIQEQLKKSKLKVWE
ncbi:Phage Tail Protein X [Wolbachia endosymbiont of Cylisticus convexus]|uniref:tail protein X n=1 Tax=Wolbachia endosymbiont of Cylisticus convexus TaxID=118728 RepID=UPI000DF6BB72|nr:tail protein X [Wolbachia endosymbiont of Cylisticus convexus]RDD33823.1 Phage Tail Protein X [Wolbachia endosymbiont of Cylisticus convexus]RDD34501.1 Phage Tail Protein X [Wolbachia endosymbiont of Cylisticus convexus]